MTDNPPDSIERSIDIRSDAQTVFRLISLPGWWINDGTITDNHVRTEGGVSVVTHAEYGEFRIRTVASEPPRRASFRWMAGASHKASHEGEPGTLIEFFIEDNASGVTLKVRESGFTSLPGTPGQRLKGYRENESGWESELEAARNHVEAA